MIRGFPSGLAACIVLCAVAAPLRAQHVQGRVLEQGTEAAVAGAVVVLLDLSGRPVDRTLSDEIGHFALRAPSPAFYRLRADRVGYRSTMSPDVEVGAQGVAGYRMLVGAEALTLEGLVVQSTSRRCTVRPGEGLGTSSVWEEARKALDAASLTQGGRWVRYELETYVRELHPSTLRIRAERQTTSGSSRSPFLAVALDRLIEHGFVEVDGDSIAFYAPDAHVLLSDEFLDTHCFRLEEGRRDEAGLIGLAFEPIPGREVPEVAGVLWVDPGTAELRHAEYRYLNLPWRIPTNRLGGRLEFRRLPTGAWIVERWYIRAPVLRPRTLQDRAPGRAIREDAGDYVLEGIHELGGAVTTFRAGQAVHRLANPGVVTGVVFDSTRSAPMPGVRVFLAGTAYAAETDADGRFRLDGIPAGEFSLTYFHPALDSVGIAPQVRPVNVRPGGRLAADLAVPSVARLVEEACPASADAGGALIVGYVKNAATGAAIPGARTRMVWAPADGGAEQAREAVAASDGFFRLCGVPLGVPVDVEARAGNAIGGPFTFQIDERRLARYDLPVR